MSKKIWKLSLLVGCCFSAIPSTTLGDDAYSIFAGVLENAHAWRNFDCFVETEVIDEIPGKEIRTARIRERLSFDHDSGKLCVISDQDHSETLLANSGGATKTRNLTKAIVSDGEKLVSRQFPSRSVSHGQPDHKKLPLELLRNMEFTDLRGVAMDMYPPRFGQADEGFDATHRDVARVLSSKFPGTVLDVGDTVQISSEMKIQGTGLVAPSMIESYIFHKKSMLPISRKLSQRLPNQQISPEYSQDIEWTEMNGCWVPLSLRAERREFYKTDEKQKGGVGKYDILIFVNFHWLHLNEEVVSPLFDPRIVDDVKLVKDLVAPVKLGIDSPAKGRWEHPCFRR